MTPAVILAEVNRGPGHRQVVDACLSRESWIHVRATDRSFARVPDTQALIVLGNRASSTPVFALGSGPGALAPQAEGVWAALAAIQSLTMGAKVAGL